MNKLRIFVDLAVAPDVLELLQAGTKGHQLVFPRTPVSSVLAKAERDPQFAMVDVAFGQPEPEAIAEANRLKWIHVSSSGITRYDNPQFRALMAERKIAVSNSASVYKEACAVHALSFVLETQHGMGHARAVSVMLPHVMDYNRIAATGKFASVALALGEETYGLSAYEGALTAVAAVNRILAEVNISSRLGDYGISKSDIPEMVASTLKQSRLFAPNARSITEEDIADIYMKGLE